MDTTNYKGYRFNPLPNGAVSAPDEIQAGEWDDELLEFQSPS